VRVHCLSTGVVRPKSRQRGVRRYLPGGWSSTTLPVNAFAVEHPAGVCMFDTGQTAAAAAPGHLPGWHPFLRLARFELDADQEAAAQLSSLGVDPQRVRWVVLSHLHTDHAGGLAGFPGADVLVSRVEWEQARGTAGRLRGYLPQHWPPGVHPRLIELSQRPWGPFAESLDLAGDGRLLVVPTPGHTRGHQSLVVRDERRTILLAGDLCPTAADLPRAAPAINAWRLREGAVVLTAHDADAPQALGGLAPASTGGRP